VPNLQRVRPVQDDFFDAGQAAQGPLNPPPIQVYKSHGTSFLSQLPHSVFTHPDLGRRSALEVGLLTGEENEVSLPPVLQSFV
jgi:hypothetical protein